MVLEIQALPRPSLRNDDQKERKPLKAVAGNQLGPSATTIWRRRKREIEAKKLAAVSEDIQGEKEESTGGSDGNISGWKDVEIEATVVGWPRVPQEVKNRVLHHGKY